MFSSSLPSTYLFVYLFLFSWGRGLYFLKIPSLPVLFSFYQLPRLAFKSKIPKHQPGYNWISEEMKNTNTPALPFESPIYNLNFWKGPRFTVSWIRAELKDLWRVLLYKEGKKQTKTRIILFKKNQQSLPQPFSLPHLPHYCRPSGLAVGFLPLHLWWIRFTSYCFNLRHATGYLPAREDEGLAHLHHSAFPASSYI